MRPGQQIERIDIEIIDVLAGHRCPARENVARLAQSIERIGLRTPITVRYVADRPSAAGTDDSYILVAGAHRLAAAKSLGWAKIECFVADVDETQARLWEIAENLHRADLTKLERDEQVAEWIKITERVSVQSAPKPQGGRPESGISAAARELGVDETDAKRAVKVSALSAEAKVAARDAGLDNNRSALLEAARQSEPSAQVAKISELALAKVNRPAPRPVRLADEPLNDFETTEKQVARLMAAWNAAGPEAREQFRDRIEKPVMDRRFG